MALELAGGFGCWLSSCAQRAGWRDGGGDFDIGPAQGRCWLLRGYSGWLGFYTSYGGCLSTYWLDAGKAGGLMVIRTAWLLVLLDIPALLLAGIRVQGVVPCKKTRTRGISGRVPGVGDPV